MPSGQRSNFIRVKLGQWQLVASTSLGDATTVSSSISLIREPLPSIANDVPQVLGLGQSREMAGETQVIKEVTLEVN
ncbi:MAG: hypothetical protein ABI596_06755 [Pyrinomonadaceae bacterium]